MGLKFNWKGVAGMALVVVPLLLLVLQQVHGFVPEVLPTDPVIYTLLMSGAMVIGFGLIAPRGNAGKFLLMALLLLVGIPVMFGGALTVADVASATDITGGEGWMYALSTIGTQVQEFAMITQIIVGLIPVAVILLALIGINMSRDWEHKKIAIGTCLLSIGVLVASVFMFELVGVSVF